MVEFVDDPGSGLGTQFVHILAKETQGKCLHCIAGIDGEWDPGAMVQARAATAKIAFVLDIVVNQKGIVQKFQRRRRDKRVFDTPAKRPAG